MKKFYLGLGIGVAISIIALAITLNYNELFSQFTNSAPEDASVLLEGEREYDYPATTLIVNQNSRGELFFCGGVLLRSNLVMSAAHCLRPESKTGVYPGDFDSNKELLYTVDSVYAHQNWQDDLDEYELLNGVPYDIGFLELEDNLDFPTAELAEPEVGCNYEIVGYGRTSEELASGRAPVVNTRSRQSSEACITKISGGILTVQPERGKGVCYGDSGSPIYIKNTNKVVGFLSVIVGQGTDGEYCGINNTAAAADISRQGEFLASFLEDNSFSNNLANNNTLDSDLEDSYQQSLDNFEQSKSNYYSDPNEFSYQDPGPSENRFSPEPTPTDTETPSAMTASDENLGRDLVIFGGGILMLLLCCTVVITAGIVMVMKLFRKK